MSIPNPLDSRLDASESAFFARQLEHVDKTLYETVFPENKARKLIPTQPGVPDWARVYTWRLFDKFGRAKIISNTADDIPRADVSGAEESKIIKPVAASYGWDVFEIKAAAATGTPLDALKAVSARFAVETEIDRILMLGDSDHGLIGLLGLSNTTSFTPADKAAGGKTWAVATPDEIIADVSGAIQAIRTALKNAGGPSFQRFDIVLPIAQYSKISQTRLGDGSDTTILKFLLESNPFVNSIEESHHSDGAGAAATDRMTVYPRNPLILAGIVPMEFNTQPPEQRNLEFVINAMASTGGVVARYPVAIAYGDGI